VKEEINMGFRDLIPWSILRGADHDQNPVLPLPVVELRGAAFMDHSPRSENDGDNEVTKVHDLISECGAATSTSV
jgi:hypothetical protein